MTDRSDKSRRDYSPYRGRDRRSRSPRHDNDRSTRRSRSPRRDHDRDRNRNRSPHRDREHYRGREHDKSPCRERGWDDNRQRSRDRSPRRDRERSSRHDRGRSRSRSRSPTNTRSIHSSSKRDDSYEQGQYRRHDGSRDHTRSRRDQSRERSLDQRIKQQSKSTEQEEKKDDIKLVGRISRFDQKDPRVSTSTSVSSSLWGAISEEENGYSSSDSDSDIQDKSQKSGREDKKKSDKDKKNKKDKKDKRDKKDKKNKKDKKDEGPASATKSGIKITPLEASDYFNKNVEFSLWVKYSQKKHFADLTSVEARELFDVFVKRWNQGKLEDIYYKGVSRNAVGAASLSGHKWNFTSKLSDADKEKLNQIKEDLQMENE